MALSVTTSMEGERPTPETALDALRDLVAEDLARTNALIEQRLSSAVPLIPQLASHLIASGGKRLRPMLTLASAQLCGYGGSHPVALAAAVEFLHTATLLHDDVVDDSDLRRGATTANALWGNQASVLVGDFLLAQAFRLMVETGSLAVLDILASAAAVIAEGEVRQLAASRDVEIAEETYLAIIDAKTATLFAAACCAPAAAAQRSAAEEAALAAYGRNLGIAYQLVDDALDYSARHARFGKTVGDDFREGKVTLPVVLAFRRGSAEERRFWREALDAEAAGGGDEADLERAVALLERHQALADTLARARDYGAAALAALDAFPAGPVRRALADIVDFCVERGY